MPKRRILSFDVESNGFFGDAFAIGAVLLDEEAKVVDTWLSRCGIQGVIDPFVQREVLPHLSVGLTHNSLHEMRAEFWTWFEKRVVEDKGLLVCADCPWPVDGGFLLSCVAKSRTSSFGGPYPFIDVASVLLGAGHDPLVDRIEFLRAQGVALPRGSKHDPLFDAHVSGLCVWCIP